MSCWHGNQYSSRRQRESQLLICYHYSCLQLSFPENKSFSECQPTTYAFRMYASSYLKSPQAQMSDSLTCCVFSVAAFALVSVPRIRNLQRRIFTSRLTLDIDVSRSLEPVTAMLDCLKKVHAMKTVLLFSHSSFFPCTLSRIQS